MQRETKPFFWVALLILISSIIFLPALKMQFWWVDDGWTIMIAQKVIYSITHFNLSGLSIIFDEPGGRFRIVYWFYQTLVYLVGGVNPTWHFLFHYLVILATALIIFYSVYNLTKSGFPSFVSASLYVLSPINNENLYRLGPQEPLLCLFISTSLYFLFVKKKTFTSILFLLLASLTKENGFILWIPIFLLYIAKRVFLKKKGLVLVKYAVWGTMASIPFILNTFLRHGGYSSNYIFEVEKMAENLEIYLSTILKEFSPFIVIFLTTYLIRLGVSVRNGKFKKLLITFLNQGVFLAISLVFIVVQTPWAYPLERYLMPATLGLATFIGLEVCEIKKMVQFKKNKLLMLAFSLFGLYFFSFTAVEAIHIYNYGGGFAHQTRFIQLLYKDLADNVPLNGTVLFNFLKGDSTAELVVQTDMQLDLVYHRPDIRVDYLNLGNLPKGSFLIVGTPTTREEYTRQEVEKGIRIFRRDESLVLENRFIVLTTATEFFKQVAKKGYQFIINRKPFSGEGIVAFSNQRDYWYRYYVVRSAGKGVE